MSRIGRLFRLAAHPRELRLALSGLAVRLEGDGALGGLTSDETQAVVRWATKRHFVEVGTLFGFTAKRLAATGQAKVVAVDNFSWNPFGMPAALHEQFTRQVLENELREGRVELVKADAKDFLSKIEDVDFVFLDGDHRYEVVKSEIELVKGRPGVKWVSGHDYGNPLFGVTAAVDETLGKPDAVVGMCWLKRLGASC